MRVECFVSYSRKDIEIASHLISILEEENIDPWWDQKISPTTDNFTKDIQEAITGCQCFLVIWTENSVSSKWVIGETKYVQDAIHQTDKIVSIAINNPLVPVPFNTNQLIHLNWRTNSNITDDDKLVFLSAVKSRMGIIGRNEHIIHPRSLREAWSCDDLAIEGPVPGTDVLLSFRPCGNSGTFLIMHFDTTDGWVRGDIPTAAARHKYYAADSKSSFNEGADTYLRIRNDVYFIKDPLRPYSIQIGGIRSARPHATPGVIEGEMTVGELKQLPIHLYWLSLTLAEILTSQDALKELFQLTDHYKTDWGDIDYKHVRDAIARNPFSPMDIQQENCRFCDANFKEKRRLYSKYGATLIANDFPFGPSFHYVVILDDPVHAWEEIQYEHLRNVNKVTHEFLSIQANRFGSVGIEYGFNSTVRHLVLGSKTHSSAGASIPHVHKQVWGMAPRTTNLAEQLVQVSDAYSDINIDYQGCYLEALRNAGYVIWEDDAAVLYVPYGQCSLHELQVMMKRPFGTYLEFTNDEITSLSIAEFLVFRLYKKLGISSFNSLFLSKLFDDVRAPDFRVVQTFVTREVDIAVSELSMLYVVDQHPADSKYLLTQAFNEMKEELDPIIALTNKVRS